MNAEIPPKNTNERIALANLLKKRARVALFRTGLIRPRDYERDLYLAPGLSKDNIMEELITAQRFSIDSDIIALDQIYDGLPTPTNAERASAMQTAGSDGAEISSTRIANVETSVFRKGGRSKKTKDLTLLTADQNEEIEEMLLHSTALFSKAIKADPGDECLFFERAGVRMLLADSEDAADVSRMILKGALRDCERSLATLFQRVKKELPSEAFQNVALVRWLRKIRILLELGDQAQALQAVQRCADSQGFFSNEGSPVNGKSSDVLDSPAQSPKYTRSALVRSLTASNRTDAVAKEDRGDKRRKILKGRDTTDSKASEKSLAYERALSRGISQEKMLEQEQRRSASNFVRVTLAVFTDEIRTDPKTAFKQLKRRISKIYDETTLTGATALVV